MEGPRAARVDELPLVESLSNEVFRNFEDATQSMFQEFPDLYCEENIDNIRVIVEDGKPVSNVNYLPSTVSIYGCNINIASLGGVATLKEYRGRGYASMLLDDCLNKMSKEGVDVLLISGDRRLYRNIGSMPAGLRYDYSITGNNGNKSPNNLSNNCNTCNFNIREFNAQTSDRKCFEKLVDLYRQESIRFVRHYDKFYELLNSSKFVMKKSAQKKIYIIEDKGNYKAYFYMVIDGNTATIYDCAGPRELIIDACSKLVEEYGLESIKGRLMTYHQSAIDFCRKKNIPLEEKRLTGTIKIVNFKGFMESLKQYFYEIYDNKFVNNLEFINDDKGACFSYNGYKCIIFNKAKLNDMIFGGAEVCREDFLPESNFDVFADFFSRVFPIPFVDPLSLNFI